MPVVFYVDPAFGNDPEMTGVSTITLGYTFFRSARPQNAKDLSRFLADAPPDPGPRPRTVRRALQRMPCARQQQDRPMLGGVVGRRAGSVPGYDYSAALQKAGLTWSTEKLEQWLDNPRAFIPGAKMPIRVLDAPSRKDIVAYLQKASRRTPRRQQGRQARFGIIEHDPERPLLVDDVLFAGAFSL